MMRTTTYKKLCTAISLLLALASAQAQPRLQQPEYYLGIHGGVSGSTVYFNPTVPNMQPLTKTALLGGNGGLVFRYAGHRVCGLQVEVNYMQRGWREVKASQGVDYTRHLHYIEIPLLTHLYFGKKAVRGFFNIGPQIGYLLKDQASGTPNPILKHEYEPINPKVDWGVAGGLGLAVRTKRAGLYQLEARFNFGLGGIFPTRTTDYFVMASPMDLTINLGYMWEFGKHNKKQITNFKTH